MSTQVLRRIKSPHSTPPLDREVVRRQWNWGMSLFLLLHLYFVLGPKQIVDCDIFIFTWNALQVVGLKSLHKTGPLRSLPKARDRSA